MSRHIHADLLTHSLRDLLTEARPSALLLILLLCLIKKAHYITCWQWQFAGSELRLAHFLSFALVFP